MSHFLARRALLLIDDVGITDAVMRAGQASMVTIFISYSHKDKTFAERLARDLKDAGFSIWIDFRGIKIGKEWREEIFKGINEADIIVPCLSPDFVNSEWSRRELLLARSQSKKVFPVMLTDCLDGMREYDETSELLHLQILNFEQFGYERGFPQLLDSLPGTRSPYTSAGDIIDPSTIPNPFKGLEAFQQTDAHLFFGQEDFIEKCLSRLRAEQDDRFLAVVGASGSGKSSLVRAGVIPALRAGKIPSSDTWPIAIFTPGPRPIESLATRLLPIVGGERLLPELIQILEQGPEALHQVVEGVLADAPSTARMTLVVDQFEEVFARASQSQGELFVNLLHYAATIAGGRTQVVITMRADFFGSLSHYHRFAELFEQTNLVIVTEMSAENLRRSVEGPAQAVGLIYDDGLVETILEGVRQQPGSLPLLQYALKELYARRDGRRLSRTAYEQSGGVQLALAKHSESVYNKLELAQQDIMRRVLLQLVEVSETGETTRRRVPRSELTLRGVTPEAVADVIDQLTAADSRLLIANREISPNTDDGREPNVWLEVSHEALIQKWERLTNWVAENAEALHFGSDLMKAAHEWEKSGHAADYAITGNRLLRAIHWLESADANDLQRAFVAASVAEGKRQQLHQRRIRNLIASVGVAIVIVVIVLISTWYQARQNEAHIASGYRIGIDSIRMLATRFDLALLLNVEGIRTAAGLDSKIDFSAKNNLLSALEYDPRIMTFLYDTSAVNTVAFSPDGKTLAAGSDDGTIRLWDVDSKQPLGQELSGHTKAVRSVVFSPDGKTLGSGSDDGTIRLWDVETRQPIGQPIGDEATPVNSVIFSHDATTLASGSSDGTIRLWSINNGTSHAQLVLQNCSSNCGINSIAFSPDDTRLVSGNDNGDIQLWDIVHKTFLLSLDYRSCRDRFRTGLFPVTSVAFSPDGKTVAAGTFKIIMLWDLQTLFLKICREDASANVNSVVFSTDNSKLVYGSGDWTGRLVDIATNIPIEPDIVGLDGPVNSVAYSQEGIVALGNAQGKIMLWNATNLDRRQWKTTDVESLGAPLPNSQSWIINLAFSPKGNTLAAGTLNDGIQLWDIETKRLIHQMPPCTSCDRRELDVAFDPTGQFLVSDLGRGPVQLWNTTTGNFITDLPNGGGWTLAYSPDGHLLAANSLQDQSKSVLLWDVSDLQNIRAFPPLDGHTSTIESVAFDRNSKTLAAGSEDGTIVLWNVSDLQHIRQIGSLQNTNHTAIWTLAFNPQDANMLAAAGASTSIDIWNVNTGKKVKSLIGSTYIIRRIAFSPDGTMLASGGDDLLARLWDLATGLQIGQPLPMHPQERVNTVAFSSDGRYLATGSSDGFDDTRSIWLWPGSIDAWEDRACQIANRNLTSDEWQTYMGSEPYAKTCAKLPSG